MTIDFNVNDINIPGFLYGTAWKEDRTEECVSSAIAAAFEQSIRKGTVTDIMVFIYKT